MRRLWPLTLRGTGALVLAVTAYVVAQRAGIPELLYFAVLLAVLLVAAAAALLLVRRTDDVARTLRPETAEVDRLVTVELRVGLRTALPTAPGRWTDTLPVGLRGHAVGDFPATGSGLRSGSGPITLRYEAVGARRGVHALGPLQVATTDPFGLVRRRFGLGGTTAVTVAPRIVDLAPLPPASGEAGGTRQTAALQLGQGADNLVARPYAPGDSMRRIHWRATAHRDMLMVRQEEQESSPAATVILDRGVRRWSPDAATAPGVDEAFETAVSACVSAVARLVHEGYTVDVVDSDGTLLADPVEGGEESEARALAAAFATVVARDDGPGHRLVPAAASALLGPVVVVTGALQQDDLIALGGVAQHSALPVLLSVGGSIDVEGLRRAGWHAATLPPAGDVAAAWDAALDRGLAHVRG
ncbi:DUF58 domain-containing protein [Microbacterium sp. HMH0099]|uniref:DUF58 domain-containing protein n=1 Tax=Microbacterium sp. HMH0099 TaxID=3414026 RepID=UPI003BF6D302